MKRRSGGQDHNNILFDEKVTSPSIKTCFSSTKKTQNSMKLKLSLIDDEPQTMDHSITPISVKDKFPQIKKISINTELIQSAEKPLRKASDAYKAYLSSKLREPSVLKQKKNNMTDFKGRAALRHKQQQEFVLESEDLINSYESVTKFKHKRSSENSTLPDIRNFQKFQQSLGVMIQDQSERKLEEKSNSNIFGVIKQRPQFSQKINEDSETEQDFEPSQGENDKIDEAPRITADFQTFKQGRKSPATQDDFKSQPIQMVTQNNPINQTGNLVTFREGKKKQRRHPEKDFIVYQLQLQAEYEEKMYLESKERREKRLIKKKLTTNPTKDYYQSNGSPTNLSQHRSFSNKQRNGHFKTEFNSIAASKKKPLQEYTQLPILKNMLKKNPSQNEKDLTFANENSQEERDHIKEYKIKRIQGRNGSLQPVQEIWTNRVNDTSIQYSDRSRSKLNDSMMSKDQSAQRSPQQIYNKLSFQKKGKYGSRNYPNTGQSFISTMPHSNSISQPRFGASTHQTSTQLMSSNKFSKRKLSPSIVRNMMIKNLNSKVMPVVIYKDAMPQGMNKQSFNALGLSLNQKSGGTSGLRIGQSSKETIQSQAQMSTTGVLRAAQNGLNLKVKLLSGIDNVASNSSPSNKMLIPDISNFTIQPHGGKSSIELCESPNTVHHRKNTSLENLDTKSALYIHKILSIAEMQQNIEIKKQENSSSSFFIRQNPSPTLKK